MNDLISRQAAIDAINCDITITGRQNAELVAATIGSFADRIKALPSAQPEGRSGVFIPDITVKNLRKAPLEAVEELLVVGEMEDIVFAICTTKNSKIIR